MPSAALIAAYGLLISPSFTIDSVLEVGAYRDLPRDRDLVDGAIYFTQDTSKFWTRVVGATGPVWNSPVTTGGGGGGGGSTGTDTPLTGISIVSGTVTAADTILSGIGKTFGRLIAHINGTADKHAALSITNAPQGGVTANNVQSAINQLDANKQPLDPVLTAVSGLPTAADKLIYATGAGTFDLTDLTAAARTLLAGVDQAAQRSSLGLGSASTLALSTDAAFTANSDTLLPTQKAVKAFVTNSLIGLWSIKGPIDTSSNPNYPAAQKGYAYVVSVAGKIGGASGAAVDIGDTVICLADSAAGTQAAVGANWFVLEHNLSGVLLAANNLSDVASPSAARTNLGLGTLATQNGTFSGSSSGTNTGDQTDITGNAGTAAKLQTTRTIDGVSFDGTTNITVIAPVTHAAASKATPLDADELGLLDSGTSFGLKKFTIANLKALLSSYFALGGGTSGQVLTKNSAGDRDYSWVDPAPTGGGGAGDVAGPAAAVDNNVAVFNGTTGKLIKDSGLTLSGSNTGDQVNVTGNAGTATKLATARTIDGVSFDGTANIAVVAPVVHAATAKASVADADELAVLDNTAAYGLKKTTVANFKAVLLSYFGLGGGASGQVLVKNSATSLDYTWTTPSINVTGNAATATALQTPRTIDGTSFNGTANVTIIAPGVHAASSKATPVDADELAMTDSAGSFGLVRLTWANLKSSILTYLNVSGGTSGQVLTKNSATALDYSWVTPAVNVSGPGSAVVDGQVVLFSGTTGNAIRSSGLTLSGNNTGDQTTITGNAGTATKLQTARNLDGIAFDGSASVAILAPATHAATLKSTLVDADELPVSDSASSFALKKTTWAAIKSGIQTLFALSGGTTGQVLRKNSSTDLDYAWATPSLGDVVGPATAIDNRVAFFNGATGKLIKDSGITLSGVNTGDQTTITGNAGTASALQTARTIDGTAFDGTANIAVIAPGIHAAVIKSTPADADEVGLVDSAASNVLKKTSWANVKASLLTYFGLAGGTTGQVLVKTSNADLAYVWTTQATPVTGPGSAVVDNQVVVWNGTTGNSVKTSGVTLSGTNTGDQTTITGNAGSATVLQTARLIDGISFNGSTSIAVVAPATHATTEKTTPADLDELPLVDSAASNALAKLTWGGLKAALVTYLKLFGGTTGQTLVKNSATALDYSWVTPANGDVVGPAVSVNNSVAMFSGTTGKLLKDSGITLSGSNTGDQTTITGNAGTATALQTARGIDGVSFDGTASIAVIGPATHGSTAKSTPVDADEMPLADSAASFGLKKLSWAALKARMLEYILPPGGDPGQALIKTTTTDYDVEWGTIVSGGGTGNGNVTGPLGGSVNGNVAVFDGISGLYIKDSGITLSGVNTGDQTTITGNAGTATVLQTARLIDGVSFDGSVNISVVAPTIHGATAKATPVDADELAVLDSAASYGIKKFTVGNLKALLLSYFALGGGTSGQTLIKNSATALDYSWVTPSVNITGNAATATALQTSRTIDGVSFDGTANVLVVAPATHAATTKATPVDADELPLTDSAGSFGLVKLTWANLKAAIVTYLNIGGGTTGQVLQKASNASLDLVWATPPTYVAGPGSAVVDGQVVLFNGTTGNLVKTSGLTLSGNNTGDQTTITGNAGTATILQTARTIDGVSFNGSANVVVIAPGTHAATALSTPVDLDEIPVADSSAAFGLKKLTWGTIKSALTTFFALAGGTTGQVLRKNSATDLDYAWATPNAGDVVGPGIAVTDHVAFFNGTTGKLIKDSGLTLSGTNTGDQTSVSGNAGTATKLATARTIDGVSFDGTADISVIAPVTHGATVKSTPVDADELGLLDSANAYGLKKFSWANLKASLVSYLAVTGGASGQVLKKNSSTDLDYSWATLPTPVTGPGSAVVDSHVVLFNGTTGNIIKTSGLTLSGTNTGDQTSVTGNAGTATTLQTARNIDGISFNGSADVLIVAPATHASTSKSAPADLDELPLVNSAASNVLAKLTWGNLKSALLTYFALGGGATGQFLKKNSATSLDYSWVTLPTADISGPGVSVDNNVAFFSGTTGKLIKDSGITLSGSNTGDQTTITGNAGTATTLQTARNIDGVSFNGSANIVVLPVATHAAASKSTPADLDEVPLTDSAVSFGLKRLTWGNLKAAMIAYIIPPAGTTGQTLVKNSVTDYDYSWQSVGSGDVSGPGVAVSNNVALFNGTTGKLIKDSGLTLSGTNTGDQTSVTGNAGTATTLQTSRNIDGIGFDGSADISVIGPATHASMAKPAIVDADEVGVLDSAAAFSLKRFTIANLKAVLLTYFGLAGGASGQVLKKNTLTDLDYSWVTLPTPVTGPGSAVVDSQVVVWSGTTGNSIKTSGVTISGTNTGDQTTITGNAGTATALQTARTIDGVSFDGTANVLVLAPATHAATSKATPVDADELALSDSAASFGLKKLTWGNVKATLLTYLALAGGTTGQVLRKNSTTALDYSWATPNAGDVVGPGVAVSGNVVLFSGTTGKLLSDSGLTLSGSNTGDQTTITGNAGTATALQTARTIDGISFNGTASITVVAPATHAAPSKTTMIGADEFAIVDTAATNTLARVTLTNLKASMNLSGTNTGDQTTITGNAGSATVLQTARLIDGQSFNGSANILVVAPATHAATGKSTLVALDEFPVADSAASFGLAKVTLANLKTSLGLTGTNSGDQTSVTGNAGTATALQTARTIDGTSFDGTANVLVVAPAIHAATAKAAIVDADELVMADSAALFVIKKFTWANLKSALLTYFALSGGTTGQVLTKNSATALDYSWTANGTGDVSGPGVAVDSNVAMFSGTTGKLIKDSGITLSGSNTGDQTTITGNAGTATVLQTARTIDGVSFNGSANILVVAPATHAATPKATLVALDELAVADSAASFGLVKVTFANLKTSLGLTGTNTGDQTTVTGNAGTATALQTARLIDGVSFDGTANITVVATVTHAATAKATPVDADELGVLDSAAAFALKKFTWANLKAVLLTYFALSGGTTGQVLTKNSATALDYSWATNGAGDVSGPGVAVSGNVVLFSGTTGKIVSDSGLTLSGTNTGDQTTITGNAGSATVLQTARTIDGVSFNGSANITVVAAATHAATTKTTLVGADELPISDSAASFGLGKVTFTNLKTSLGLTGTNSGDQTTITGNAGSATVLQTARTIDGVSFDGSANIVVVSTVTHAATAKATPVDADELGVLDSAASFALKKFTWANLKAVLLTYFALSGGTTGQVLTKNSATALDYSWTTNGTGDLSGPGVAVDSNVALFNGTTGKLVKDSGLTLSGSNTGDQTTITGNAGTATVLQTARTIDGVSFNGSANITVVASATHAATSKTTLVALDEIPISDSAASFGLGKVTFTNLKTSLGLTGTNSGDQTTVTGNAGTATTLQTARLIDGVSFNGSADISVLPVATHAATSKTTPVDADEIPLSDSAALFVLKKLTWANIKATLLTYFALSGGTTGQVLTKNSATALDYSWASPATGNVTGAASSVSGNVVVFSGITGKIIADSGLTLSGSNTGDQTTITGNAGSATVLQTARTIDGVSFNGSANITVIAPATHAATGKTTLVSLDELAVADSAASFALVKVTFANLKTSLGLTGTNTGDQTTITGNAGTATALQTARTIDGISFDGTANIAVVAAATHAATSKTTLVAADELPIADSAASFALGRVTFTNLKASLGLTGTNSGDQTTVTGNAGSATVLQTARTIDGISFNGSANIAVVGPATAAATVKATPIDADSIPLSDSAGGGALAKLTWANLKATLLTYFALSGGTTGQVLKKNSATALDYSWATPASGDVVGPGVAVSGNVALFSGTTGKLISDSGLSISGTNTGDQTTVTGNAGSATILQTARTIDGVSFNGSASITVVAPATHAATSKTTLVSLDELPLSDSAASFGLAKVTFANLKTSLGLTGTNSGDQTTVTGNAGTATALQTARNIDGQSFNGTADITVIAPGTHAATSKATPVDADEIPLVDSAALFVLKRLTWANLKATLLTYFALGGGTTGQVLAKNSATALDYSWTTFNGVAGPGSAVVDSHVVLFSGTTGNLIKTSGLTLSGTNTGDQTTITGNAGTATVLQTARTIDGVSFNGSANIAVVGPATAAATTKATPVDADSLALSDSAASNALAKLTWANLKATLLTYFALSGGTTGQVLKKNSATALDYSWATPAAGDVVGPGVAVSGNVALFSGTTGKLISDSGLTISGTNTGDQTTVSGNAGTATTLQTARTIDGVSFNGSANIVVVAPATHAATSKTTLVAADELPVSDSAASFGLAKVTFANLKSSLGLTGTNSGDQTTVTGNAGTATALQTARTIDGVSFDGTANIVIVAAATHAATSKTTLVGADEIPISDSAASFGLGKVTFTNLKTSLGLTGTNSGDQTTVTGNAGTATALQTARTIDGVSFNGTANIAVVGPATAAATTKATPIDADSLPLSDSASGNALAKLTWANLKATLLTYFALSGGTTGQVLTKNSATALDYSWATPGAGNVTGAASSVSGNVVIFSGTTGKIIADSGLTLSGTNTGDQTTVTGNAGSATVLQTARTIDGVSFNGSANITVIAPATHAASAKTTLVSLDELAVADSAASFALVKVTFANLKSSLGLTGTNSGDQTTITGNAGTATALQTARTIDGVSFDGTANITVIAAATHAASSKTTLVAADELPLVDSAAGNALARVTFTNLKASLGLTGTNSGDQTTITGNAGTATTLQTARTIDGVSFNGSANIAVIGPATAAATSKTTPVDADSIPLSDSAASNALAKLTFANLKATLLAYIGVGDKIGSATLGSGTITLDMTGNVNIFNITLTENKTISITNRGSNTDGRKILLRLNQDTTGSRLITSWGSNVRFGTDLATVTLTTTVSKTDHCGLVYNATDDMYDFVALSRGF